MTTDKAMTPEAPMDSLIERLERAMEGSRHLDSWIAAYVGIGEWNLSEWLSVVKDPTFGPEPAIPEAPHYTTSLDAALTLVPEGCILDGFSIWPGNARATIAATHKDENGQIWHGTFDGRWQATAPTGPLALTLAALKARESHR
jgi:hypothetical protein